MAETRAARTAVVVLAVALGACRDRASTTTSTSTAVSASASASGMDAGLSPLQADWMEQLDLGEGRLAYVAPPVGSTEKRPVIVAIHGAIDDAGLICSAWRLIADAYPFVVCPAGSKLRKDVYVWPSSDAIESSVGRALAAARVRWGDRIAEGPITYVAFSQGANFAGPVLSRRGAVTTYARAVLTEGGYGAFDDARARGFVAQAGPEPRVLLTCSQSGCAGMFGGAKAALERAGVGVRVVFAGAYGHSMVPEVRRSIHESLGWLVEGAPGWETYGAAPKLETH
jgi:hypothetical protein